MEKWRSWMNLVAHVGSCGEVVSWFCWTWVLFCFFYSVDEQKRIQQNHFVDNFKQCHWCDLLNWKQLNTNKLGSAKTSLISFLFFNKKVKREENYNMCVRGLEVKTWVLDSKILVRILFAYQKLKQLGKYSLLPTKFLR